MRLILSIPDNQVAVLDKMVRQGASPSRNALIQQVITAFLSDLRERRPQQNPSMLHSALGALVGGFLFGLGVAALAKIFEGDNR